VLIVFGRVEESVNCECASCPLSDLTEPSTSEQPPDNSESQFTEIISNDDVELNRCEPDAADKASMSASLCETDFAVETGVCENTVSTKTHSVDSALLDNHQSNTSDATDVAKEVVVNSMEQAPDSTDLYRYPADNSHENLTYHYISEPESLLCNDLKLSQDPDSGDVLSVETESELVIESETQTKSFMRNANVDSHHDCAAITNQRMSAVDILPSSRSDDMACSAAVAITNSVVTKLSGNSGMRCILTAALSEVTIPAEETVAHIGSTHIHITDELSVINGVVQPVDSPVKIGEFLILYIILSLQCFDTVDCASGRASGL